MKINLSTCALGLAALFAGAAYAGDQPTSDAPRGLMQADKDGDGKISRAEFQAAGSDRSAAWFDKLDTNKDGFLSSDELKTARASHHEMRGDMRGKMDERFTEADANHDGQLSLEEVQAKMPHLADRFTALDTDHNGQLSKDELRAGHGGWHRGGQQPQGAPQG